MGEKKVSVVVPMYKVEKELDRCVTSILAQDYSNLEIILVDDGSPDNTGKIADQYGQEYPQVVRVIHQVNKGLSGARNTGIAAANGEYIQFVDSDDFIEPNTISTMVNAIESTASDVATCGRFDDYPSKTRINFTMEEPKVLSSTETMQRILTWNQMDIAAWDKLFKTELWNDVRFPEGENNEDIRAIPFVLHKANKIAHVGIPLYHYCHRENSITTTYNEKKIKDFYKAVTCMEKAVQNNYPTLQNELIYYLNHSYLSLWMMCEQIGYFVAEKQVAIDYLKDNWKNAFSKEMFLQRDKVAYYLLKYRIYHIVKKIKTIVVNARKQKG